MSWRPLGLCLALLLALSRAMAQEADFEVWRDSLPDTLPASELDIVVISPPSWCVPNMVKTWLGEADRSGGSEEQRLVCRQALPQLLGQTPQGVRVRQVYVETGSRSVAAEVAQVARLLADEPLRRYVALVRWDAWALRNYMGMSFEEVLYDRDAQRWLWQATRREQSWKFVRDSRAKHLEEALSELKAVLLEDLPHALTQRGRARHGDLPATVRWVPAADVDTWTPGERAGLVLVNEDHMESSNATAPFDKLTLRTPGEADRSRDILVPGTWRHRQHAQTSPPIQRFTYAVLELPPGDYLARYGSRDFFPLSLKPGETAVMTTRVQFLREGDTRTMKDLPWFREVKPKRRHAFLVDGTVPVGARPPALNFREP